MSPLAAIWQTYHSKVNQEGSIHHSDNKSGSLPNLSIDEVVVQVSSVSDEQGVTCQSAVLLNELLAQSPKICLEGKGASQARPVSANIGSKDGFVNHFSIGFVNNSCLQLGTSYPNNSSGFKLYHDNGTNSRLSKQQQETSRNPSSSSSLSSANTAVSSIPMSSMYQNPHKAVEQSQLSQLHVDNDLYLLAEQDFRFTPELYRMSPFAMDYEASINGTQETTLGSICPSQLESNRINYLLPVPIHLKLKQGLLENIQHVFNQTLEDEDDGNDNEGVLSQLEGPAIGDSIMSVTIPQSTSPRQYSFSRLSSPQLSKLSMYKFATTPAPADSFETPIAPETTPVSNTDVSEGASPFAEDEEGSHSSDDVDVTIRNTKDISKSSWTDSSKFYNASTSGIETSRIDEYKKAFFKQYSKASITKVKLTDTDRGCLPKDCSKPDYLTIVNSLDVFTCSKFAATRKYKCPVKECPLHFLGIKKRAELKHHVHYEHLKNGFVKNSCRQYEDEIMKILFVCNEANCGKAFYRCDSLNRHLNLVHGNGRTRGVKRKVSLTGADVAENADEEYAASYDGDSELEGQAGTYGYTRSTLGKRRKLSN